MGLSFAHTPAHVARAVLEGLTTVIRDCLSAVPVAPAELRVCGGGAASGTWCQLIADVTGLATSRSTDTEVGARGAMITGAVRTGAAAGFAEAVERYVELAETFVPDPARTQVYAQMHGDVIALRESAASAWPRLAEIRARGPVTGANIQPAVTPEALARAEGLPTHAIQGTVTFPRRQR
jgi:xylulokinase